MISSRACIRASLIAGLVILALQVCPIRLLAQEGVPPTEKSPEGSPVDVQIFGEVKLNGGPYEKEGPGFLVHSGYVDRGARHTKLNYQSTKERLGEANVQIAVHSASYPFVLHDFYGWFFAVRAEGQQGQGAGQASKRTPESLGLEFVRRETTGGSRQNVVCYLKVDNPPGDSGALGWYTQNGPEATTLVVGFEHLGGPPWALVEHYLAKYPSSVVQDAPEFQNWPSNDITKWVDLLRNRGSEDLVLGTATTHLRQFDTRAFGLFEAIGKRSDPAAVSQVIEAAVPRMMQWLEEYEQAKRDKPGR